MNGLLRHPLGSPCGTCAGHRFRLMWNYGTSSFHSVRTNDPNRMALSRFCTVNALYSKLHFISRQSLYNVEQLPDLNICQHKMFRNRFAARERATLRSPHGRASVANSIHRLRNYCVFDGYARTGRSAMKLEMDSIWEMSWTATCY